MKPVEMPLRLRQRPLYKGMPVPALVMWVNGVPDFRVTDMEQWNRLASNRLCSLCGTPLKRLLWFIGGSQFLTNRLFFDLPVHEECGLYAFKVCPYLALSTSSHNTAKGLPGAPEWQMIVKYKAEVAAGRPKQMGFGATDGYIIGVNGDDPTHNLVQANPWLLGPYWLTDREDAERYEAGSMEEKQQWLTIKT